MAKDTWHYANLIADMLGSDCRYENSVFGMLYQRHPTSKAYLEKMYGKGNVLDGLADDYPDILQVYGTKDGTKVLAVRKPGNVSAPLRRPSAPPSRRPPANVTDSDDDDEDDDIQIARHFGQRSPVNDPPPIRVFRNQTKTIELRAKTTTRSESRGEATLSSRLETDAEAAAEDADAVASRSKPFEAFARAEKDVDAYFYPSAARAADASSSRKRLATLLGERTRVNYDWSGLIGYNAHNSGVSPVFMNTREPFCVMTLGVQGSGKSHTTAVIAEACMTPFESPLEKPVVSLPKPMAALALHFGKHDDDPCELAGLLRPADSIKRMLRGGSKVSPPRVRNVVVLTSPSYHKQRRKYYGGVKDVHVDVQPLLFNWGDLKASHLRTLMRLEEKESQQLYVSVLLDLLRRYQQDDKIPDFEDFFNEVKELCQSQSQSSPLEQRLQLLESFVAESERNKASKHVSLEECVKPGTMVIVDLTDPLLSVADANALFQVLLERFRLIKCPSGKLCVLDEAHRYLVSGAPLAASLVDAVRVMRHEGMRVVVSTQSPLTLPQELLELCSAAFLHNFHSQDWYEYLSRKVSLPKDGFRDVMRLEPGEALVFARRVEGLDGAADAEDDDAADAFAPTRATFKMRIRDRLTHDLGASMLSARADDERRTAPAPAPAPAPGPAHAPRPAPASAEGDDDDDDTPIARMRDALQEKIFGEELFAMSISGDSPSPRTGRRAVRRPGKALRA